MLLSDGNPGGAEPALNSVTLLIPYQPTTKIASKMTGVKYLIIYLNELADNYDHFLNHILVFGFMCFI